MGNNELSLSWADQTLSLSLIGELEMLQIENFKRVSLSKSACHIFKEPITKEEKSIAAI